MTKAEAEVRWRELGALKLRIRRTLGWESDMAKALLKIRNKELDKCLEIMRQRD